MPKATFLNLEAGKKQKIKDAFLREFALKTFDEASITEVVKQLGIAKGSVYQYFDDKQDLFMYLLGECGAVKMKYLLPVKRENYEDFWAFFVALYDHGFRFDDENPLESHFLHQLAQNLYSPSVHHLFRQMMVQTVGQFEIMVQYEVEEGLFRNDIPVKIMGYMLYKVGLAIHDYLEYSGVINPRKSILENTPVFQGKKEVLLNVVGDFIRLNRPSFDNS